MIAKIAIDKIIDYCWKDELRDFQEVFNFEIQSQDNLDFWLDYINSNDTKVHEEMKNHIFYSLMVLKYQFQNLE